MNGDKREACYNISTNIHEKNSNRVLYNNPNILLRDKSDCETIINLEQIEKIPQKCENQVNAENTGVFYAIKYLIFKIIYDFYDFFKICRKKPKSEIKNTMIQASENNHINSIERINTKNSINKIVFLENDTYERKHNLLLEFHSSHLTLRKVNYSNLYLEYKKRRRNFLFNEYWLYPEDLIKTMQGMGILEGVILNTVKHIFMTIYRCGEEESMTKSIILCLFKDKEYKKISSKIASRFENFKIDTLLRNTNSMKLSNQLENMEIQIKNLIERIVIKSIPVIETEYCTYNWAVNEISEHIDIQNIENYANFHIPEFQEMIEELIESFLFQRIVDRSCWNKRHAHNKIQYLSHNCPIVKSLINAHIEDENITDKMHLTDYLRLNKNATPFKAAKNTISDNDTQKEWKDLVESEKKNCNKITEMEKAEVEQIYIFNQLKILVDDSTYKLDRFCQINDDFLRIEGLIYSYNENLHSDCLLKSDLYEDDKNKWEHDKDEMTCFKSNESRYRLLRDSSFMFDEMISATTKVIYEKALGHWQIRKDTTEQIIRSYLIQNYTKITKTLVNALKKYTDGISVTNRDLLHSEIYSLIVMPKLKSFVTRNTNAMIYKINE